MKYILASIILISLVVRSTPTAFLSTFHGIFDGETSLEDCLQGACEESADCSQECISVVELNNIIAITVALYIIIIAASTTIILYAIRKTLWCYFFFSWHRPHYQFDTIWLLE